MDLDVIALMNDTQKIVARVVDQDGWIVILCPDQASVKACSQAVSGSLPPGSVFSGRTARIGRGKISVACITDEVFVPDGTTYSVAYLGWRAKDVGGLSKWQSRASQVIVL